jgi:glycosyltransferase involved in cell wall biosynthesis
MSYRLGLVMEQTLGHVTHAQNFRHWLARDPDVTPSWIPIDYVASDRWGRAPLVNRNWTLLASLRARTGLRAVLRSQPLDALFFHTQVTALFAQRLMTRIPTVVSMDATPLNFDRIGSPYMHAPSGFSQVEAVKNALNRRTFKLARRLIVWHEWGKESLVREYGVNAEKVVVIPPGIDLERWQFRREGRRPGPVRLLFVGGDFRRKGGDALLVAFRRELQTHCELDIVTRESVDTQGMTSVRVHHGLGPNSPGLMELYARADVFVFPTLGDSLPIAIMEAMASGLPVVATSVGAIAEQVDDGVNGFLVPENDPAALAAATLRLTTSDELRVRMGAAARRTAERLFSGSHNYQRVLAVCKSCADGG